MAKETIILANEIDLAQIPLVQNEKGWFYRNGAGVYFKPLLNEFDTITPPAGYVKYTDGTHLPDFNKSLFSFDFALVADTKVSMNHDFKVLVATKELGSYIYGQDLVTGKYYFFVHVYYGYKYVNGTKVPIYPAIGSVIKAYDAICLVAPKWVTGYDPHLHTRLSTGLNIRYIILDGKLPTDMSKFNVNDRVLFTGPDRTNIRAFPDTSTPANIIGQAQPNAVAVIRSVATTAGNFIWYLVQFGDLWGVAFDGTMQATTNPMTNLDGSVYTPANSAELEQYKTANKALNDQVTSLNGTVTTLTDQLKNVKKLEDYKTEELLANVGDRVKTAQGNA